MLCIRAAKHTGAMNGGTGLVLVQHKYWPSYSNCWPIPFNSLQFHEKYLSSSPINYLEHHFWWFIWNHLERHECAPQCTADISQLLHWMMGYLSCFGSWGESQDQCPCQSSELYTHTETDCRSSWISKRQIRGKLKPHLFKKPHLGPTLHRNALPDFEDANVIASLHLLFLMAIAGLLH